MRRTLAILAVAALFAAAGCDTAPPADSGEPAGGVRLYGSDGNMSNALGENLGDLPGVLTGMKGTAPIAPLPADVRQRLVGVAPGLRDFNYAGQSYDAVAIAALATEIARTTKGSEIAKYLAGVTTGGVECTTVARCLELVRAGTDIQYRGLSLRRGGFTEHGEPATATYGTLHFSRQNEIDEGKTEYVGAGSEADTTKAPQPAAPPLRQEAVGAPLVIGELLPRTGQLAGLFPPMHAGAQLAILDINAAGGVLEEKVTFVEGDDGTNPEVAKRTVEQLLSRKVHVIIGAGPSGVSKAVIPRVTGAGVLMISPSATADELSTIADNGLFFRTAAPDLLQAKALADVVMRDGPRRIYIVARDDAWGQGLLKAFKENLATAGLRGEAVKQLIYQPSATAAEKPNIAQLAGEVKQFKPDGVVILGFDESSHIISALVQGGVTLHD